MKRIASEEEDDLRPEYDFSQMKARPGIAAGYIDQDPEKHTVLAAGT